MTTPGSSRVGWMLWGALWVGLAGAAVETDRVARLPGWPGALPSAMYSGYLDATPANETGRLRMHYVLVESERDPATDPLVVWSNGGPGAASEFGLFTELGPFYLSDQSTKTAEFNQTGVPSLFRNRYGWTSQANLLIYDAPPPVGFSYCDDQPGGDGYSCGDWDDYRAARAAHSFIKSFMAAYPRFNGRPLYLTGESYAGVYIPMLARAILEDEHSTIRRQLRGMAIGDGCAGTEVLCGEKAGPWFRVQFFHGHGQVSDKLYGQLLAVCGVQQLQRGVTDPDCERLVAQMETAIGGAFAYNLYDECGKENALLLGQRSYWSRQPALTGALNDYPCGGIGSMLRWLNRSEVKAALHVPAAAAFFLSDNGVGFNYSLTERNLLPFYQRVISDRSLRVLVYNGDTDPGINSFVAQNWTSALGFKELQPWRPWTLDGQQRMGGYVTRYENDFDFLTIRGSGHMVPEYKPAAALEFITRWLDNKDYRPYVPPPTPPLKREL